MSKKNPGDEERFVPLPEPRVTPCPGARRYAPPFRCCAVGGDVVAGYGAGWPVSCDVAGAAKGERRECGKYYPGIAERTAARTAGPLPSRMECRSAGILFTGSIGMPLNRNIAQRQAHKRRWPACSCAYRPSSLLGGVDTFAAAIRTALSPAGQGVPSAYSSLRCLPGQQDRSGRSDNHLR